MANEHDRAILNSIFNPLVPVGEVSYAEENSTELIDVEEETPAVKESKQFEVDGVKAAEAGDLALALTLFNKAIFVSPQRASGFNNRAQVHRLNGDVSAALVDLNNALNLSQRQGRAARQALCQRALLHMREGQQDLARNDLEAAAKLGSTFARSQLAQLNPYAALCNKMLQEAFMKLQKGEPDIPPKE